MINIDGSKIRRLREERGLTQLYIATAVEVTTDTVSRWENKRYPSIKKENGLRLAQALEVELEDILDTTNRDKNTNHKNTENAPEGHTSPQNDSPSRRGMLPLPTRTAVLLSLMLIPLFMFLMYSLYVLVDKNKSTSEITVTRIVSPHFIAGQPFPVFLQLSTSKQDSRSFILRETPTPGITVLSTFPAVSAKQLQGRSIQWLESLSGPTVFAYTLTSEKDFGGTIQFNGIVKLKSGSGSEIKVTGDNSSSASRYHWADRNQDSKISDEEILTVYDLVTPVQNDSIDMDLLEEMWLGDGYIWHPDEQRFSILE